MKLIEVIAESGSVDTIASIAEKHQARDFRLAAAGQDGRQAMRLLVSDDRVQGVLDALQTALTGQPDARILVIPVEAALPRPAPSEQDKEESATAAREALYSSVAKNTRLDSTYLLLVALSTIVAAIGLIENNVAVIIGAMVIAPLLGPNLALALGTALGDVGMMRDALITFSVGIALALGLSIAIGLAWPIALDSPELLARTDVGLDSVALALASGAAAALSMTTGLPSVLVGVMVAVALLPPLATLGLMLARGQLDLATGAALLLAVNVVSVNLAAKLVLLFRGVRPRRWVEKQLARRTMFTYILIWAATLLLLGLAIFGRTLTAG